MLHGTREYQVKVPVEGSQLVIDVGPARLVIKNGTDSTNLRLDVLVTISEPLGGIQAVSFPLQEPVDRPVSGPTPTARHQIALPGTVSAALVAVDLPAGQSHHTQEAGGGHPFSQSSLKQIGAVRETVQSQVNGQKSQQVMGSAP